ncbi:hypothetical protein J4457_07345 [Candidatus Woesearchaeota archaeon]|nr:hypothetical protein [Candidatus Woesearchaeota archaeon]
MSDSLSTYRLPCSVSGEDVRCVVRILGNIIRHNGPVQRAEPSYIFDLETQIAGEITVRGANGRLTVGVYGSYTVFVSTSGKNAFDKQMGLVTRNVPDAEIIARGQEEDPRLYYLVLKHP